MPKPYDNNPPTKPLNKLSRSHINTALLPSHIHLTQSCTTQQLAQFHRDTDRLLYKLYELIDNGSYVQAQKLIIPLLQRYFNIPILLALQLLLYVHTNQWYYAIQLCPYLLDENHKIGSYNDKTIQIIQLALNIQHNTSYQIKLYDALITTNSKHTQQYLIELYVIYYQSYDFMNAQKIAMKLYNKYKHIEYLYWSCVALMDQHTIHHTTTAANKSYHMLVTINCKLLLNKCNDMCSSAELTDTNQHKYDIRYNDNVLYVLVELYKLLHQHTDSLNYLLQYNTSIQLHSYQYIQYHTLHIELMLLNNMYLQVCDTIQQHIRANNYSNIENYTMLIQYLDCHKQFDNHSNGSSNDINTLTITPINEFLTELKSIQPYSRTAYLIDIEYAHRCQHNITGLLHEYYTLFGDKLCYYNDIMEYINKISPGDQISLVNQLYHSLQPNHRVDGVELYICDSIEHVHSKRIIQLINLYSVLFHCNYFRHLTTETLTQYITYFHSIIHSLHQSNTEYHAGDINLCDSYVMFYSLICVQLNDKQLLDECIELVTEHKNKHSTTNYLIKLLLIKLILHNTSHRQYDVDIIVALYKSIPYKQIQNENCMYSVIYDMYRYGYYDSYQQIYKQYHQWCDYHSYDTNGLVLQSIQTQMYVPLTDLTRYQYRIKYSMVYCMTRIEYALTDVYSHLHNLQQCRTIIEQYMIEYGIYYDYSDIVDVIHHKLINNNDYSIIPQYIVQSNQSLFFTELSIYSTQVDEYKPYEFDASGHQLLLSEKYYLLYNYYLLQLYRVLICDQQYDTLPDVLNKLVNVINDMKSIDPHNSNLFDVLISYFRLLQQSTDTTSINTDTHDNNISLHDLLQASIDMQCNELNQTTTVVQCNQLIQHLIRPILLMSLCDNPHHKLYTNCIQSSILLFMPLIHRLRELIIDHHMINTRHLVSILNLAHTTLSSFI